MRILVVEPNAHDRSELCARLRDAGYESAGVGDGVEALAELRAAPFPDLIVSEILAPRMDGFALCRELRRRRDTASVAFLFYTESDDEAALALARRLGADAFVAKSEGHDAVLARVRDLPPAGPEREGADLLADAADPQFLYEHLSCLFHLLGCKVQALERANVEQRRQAEEKIRRLNRVYAMLSGINGLIVRVRERDELFREATRLAVETGQVQAAWIGVVDRAQKRVRPVAWAGEERGMLRAIEPRLALEPGPDGRYTLVGQAVAEKRALVADDVLKDPRIVIKEALASRGVRSVTALPLVIGGEVVAVLSLLAREPGFFDAAEIQLLGQLASDIAFALDHIDKAERLSFLAYYDPLTGLANRALFHERLDQFVHIAERDRQRLALCIIDLDRFKYVNDSLGRQAGDALLAQFGQRLLGCVRDPSHVAPLEADRFALVLSGVAGEAEVVNAIDRLMPGWTGEPFLLGGEELRLAARMGIALFPADGRDADTLFRNSEAALKKAKTGGDRFLFYKEQMTDRVAEKLALETKLRRALEKREFEVHYQPKVDTETREVLGVEALIRWRDPGAGLVLPMQFIPLLEETGLIAEAGAWVLEQAVRDYDAWQAQGLAAPPIAVNVSAVQLRRRDFMDAVRRALGGKRATAPIELEITESVIMENLEEHAALLNALHAEGIGVTIDDFGTGYSSLGYLARLPAQALKVDRSFVDRMVTDRDVFTLVSTMISLAHSMRLRVIAEGVETEQQADVLRRLRCDELQGYLISPPVPHQRITELLRETRPHGTTATPTARPSAR